MHKARVGKLQIVICAASCLSAPLEGAMLGVYTNAVACASGLAW